MPRSASERLVAVNETKLKCIEHDLTEDLATKILFTMLDNYHKKGTTYIKKDLKLAGRHQTPRKYVVNLYNDRNKKDVVLIRALNDEEETQSADARMRRAVEGRARNITSTWKRDPVSGLELAGSESEYETDTDTDSDSDAPDLVDIQP
jgi:hypothetical protein